MQTVIVPCIHVILVFLPVSLPLGLILVEAITTANVLATSEALIHFGMGSEDSDDNASMDGSEALRGGAGDGLQSTSGSGSGDGGGKSRGKSMFFKGTYMNMSGGARGRGRPRGENSDDEESSEDSDRDCLDEYQDEDIDER